MDISLYTVILLTGLFIFFICVCADSSLFIYTFHKEGKSWNKKQSIKTNCRHFSAL